MEFDKSIVLTVVDKTKGTIAKVNKSLEATRKATDRIKKSTLAVAKARKVTARATKASVRAAERLARVTGKLQSRALKLAPAFDRAHARSRRFFGGLKRSIAGAIRKFAKLGAAAAAVIPAAAVFAANKTSGDIAKTERSAQTLGLDVNAYDRLVRYLELASDKQLSDDDVFGLLREFQKRITGESGEGQQKETLAALRKIGEAIGVTNLDTVVASETDVSKQIGQVLDALRQAAKLGKDSQSLSLELFKGAEGEIISRIVKQSDAAIKRIGDIITRTTSLISDEDVKNAKDFRTEMATLGDTYSALISEIVKPALPAITEALSTLTNLIQELRPTKPKPAEPTGAQVLTERIEQYTEKLDKYEKYGPLERFVTRGQIPLEISALQKEVNAAQAELNAMLGITKGVGNSFVGIAEQQAKVVESTRVAAYSIETFAGRMIAVGDTISAAADNAARKLNNINPTFGGGQATTDGLDLGGEELP